jgi:CheY-like chemotaxis protein
MTGKSVLQWLGRGRATPEAAALRLGDRLRECGVSEDVLAKAMRQRGLLRTRLASVLVENGAVDEMTALASLSRHVGRPGLALRRSVIDLACPCLTPEQARGRLVLPVQRTEEGDLVLAYADPLQELELQELELRFGCKVLVCVALHLHLSRAVQAVAKLRRESVDARFLLGDDVKIEEVADPANHVSWVRPQLPLPELRRPQPAAPPKPRALLAVAEARRRQELAAAIAGAGLEVVAVEDGPAALRSLARGAHALLVLDAQLPGRSGVDIIRRLGRAERYQPMSKVLIAPSSLGVATELFAGIDGLTIVSEDQAAAQIGTVAAGAAAALPGAGDGVILRARAVMLEGLALREALDIQAATLRFREALCLEPLLADAHREIGRLRQAAGALSAAADAFAMVVDLGGGDNFDDAVRLAEVVQQQGNLQPAARLWRRAAALCSEPVEAAALCAHAAMLSPARSAQRG